jgi:hypothetical protein
MSKVSPVARAFHDAFERELLPLLGRIGLTRAKPKNVKPGLIVALAVRALEEQRRVEATLWCDGGSGANLRFRFDVVEPLQGLECSRQIELELPWPDPDYPKQRHLEFCGNELRPGESAAQLTKAITLLAGGLAANADRIARAVPELAHELRAAADDGAWRSAVERSAELWRTRHVRGELDERSAAATVVFVGSQLVSVDADGARLTFRFDARAFDRALPVSVSGWHRTPAGTRVARKLTNGATTWTFDFDGKLVSVTGASRE